MWLPAFKYIKGLFALRGQFLQPSGEPYEGAYHKLYNGRTFTGDIPSTDSIEIFEDDSEPHLLDNVYEDQLVSEPVFPSPEDYDKGFFTRYFIKDSRSSKIVEVEKQTYSNKIKEKFLSGTTLKWILDKPVKDIFNQGYLYKGAITRNKENTNKASLILKNLNTYIDEYDKFVNVESDVEGYKFEELPRKEKVRIIRKQSPLRKTPKLKYPHTMYNPKTGQGVIVQNEKEHTKYMRLKWVHEKPRFTKKIKPLKMGDRLPKNTSYTRSSGGNQNFEGIQESSQNYLPETGDNSNYY